MAKGPQFGLKPAFFKRAMKELGPQLEKKGDEIAAAVGGGYEADSRLKYDRNGRPVVLVALKHPNGKAVEVRDGLLAKAARSKGATVHRYGKG